MFFKYILSRDLGVREVDKFLNATTLGFETIYTHPKILLTRLSQLVNLSIILVFQATFVIDITCKFWFTLKARCLKTREFKFYYLVHHSFYYVYIFVDMFIIFFVFYYLVTSNDLSLRVSEKWDWLTLITVFWLYFIVFSVSSGVWALRRVFRVNEWNQCIYGDYFTEGENGGLWLNASRHPCTVSRR